MQLIELAEQPVHGLCGEVDTCKIVLLLNRLHPAVPVVVLVGLYTALDGDIVSGGGSGLLFVH